MRKVEPALAAVAGVVIGTGQLVCAGESPPFTGAPASTAVDLVEALDRIGFKAAEIAPDSEASAKAHRSGCSSALGIAGFAAANIMLLSVSVWSGGGGE